MPGLQNIQGGDLKVAAVIFTQNQPADVAQRHWVDVVAEFSQ